MPGGSDFAKTDAFPQELLCPLHSACVVTIRKHLKVVAFEPKVEVELIAPSEASSSGSVRYRDASSLSAALGDALARGTELRKACLTKAPERAAMLEHSLRELAASGAPPQVRSADRLLLVEHQCSGAPENVAIAKQLLTELDPTSSDLVLWTDAIAMLGNLAGDDGAETALIDAVIAKHPSEHVIAQLLLMRLFAAIQAGDFEKRDVLVARLREPRFSRTGGLIFARHLVAFSDPLRIEPGDALPPFEVPLLDGGTLTTATPRTGPLLVYFSASWCKGCVESLPRLRKLAKDHPELQIAYVLWESAASAKTFVQHHSPIPGKIANADEDGRAAIQASILKSVVLPTFVLVDAAGKVIATSKDEKLDTLDGKLDAVRSQ